MREVSHHPPEVVVLDLGLPDLDGGQALKMMRAITAIPVIVATARDEEAEIIRLLNDGADDYVVKPFSGEQRSREDAKVMRASIRTTLALVSAAVTSMVAIAFLIPLAVIVRDVARDRAFTSAQLAGQIAVYLTTIAPAASKGTLVGGAQHASTADLRAATTAARSFIAPVPGGYVVLQPVALGSGRVAITEVYVPAGEVDRGVTASWAVMTAVALALIGVSVLVADRLATRVTRPARELALAAAALGDGDLSARSASTGPAELAAAGHAFKGSPSTGWSGRST
ncbi:MAG: response regulator [Trebonia sp.]